MEISNYSNDEEKEVNKEDNKSSCEDVKNSSNDIKAGSKTFLGGIVLGGALYVLIVWLLFVFLNLHYAVIATMAFAIAIAFLIAFQKSTGLEAARMQSPILVIMLVIFVLIVSYRYSKDMDLDKNKPKISNNIITFKSETFSFTGNERWVTNATFPKGKEYKITVKGVSVNLINGNDYLELTPEHGPYTFVTNSDGSPTFDGIDHGNGSRSNVTVVWKE